MSIATDAQITWSYSYDLDAASAFYGQLLQLTLVMERGGCRIYRVTDGAFLGVCAANERRIVEPKGTLVTFVTDEVDRWYERLSAADVLTDGPPRALPQYGIYAFFATGPDGYQIEFQRFDDAAWAKPS